MEAGHEAGPNRRARTLAVACIAAAVGAGIIAFTLGGAPSGYAVSNAAALALLTIPLAVPGKRRTLGLAPSIAVGAVALLTATLWFGPSLEGVRRWIEVGPIRLHAGMLTIPALVALLLRLRDTIALFATGVCVATIWLQPDFAAALALFAGIACATAGRSLAFREHALRLLATIGLIATAFRPDPLTGVRFVEAALGDGWAISTLLGFAMAITLALAVFVPPLLLTKDRPDLIPSARAVSGAMVGFSLAGLLAAFPQPLIGYGASPILGYGLALAVLRFSR